MAFFGVTIEKIDKVWKHPNADSLDLASLEGITFQFVVGKDSMKPGDKVVYFPVDSLLPDVVKAVLPEVVVSKLHGKDKNRVKTNKLRGAISQGLAFKIEEMQLDKFGIILGKWAPQKTLYFETTSFDAIATAAEAAEPVVEATVEFMGHLLPKDLTKYLGVEKYEPPIVDAGGYDLHALPMVSPYYDIEGCDRHQHILDLMMRDDVEVVITEKLEGCNSSVVCELPDETVRVCQRSGEIVPLPGAVSVFHEAAKLEALPDKAKAIAKEYGSHVAIRGELLGCSAAQGNYYKLKKPTIHAFEIWLNGKPIDYVEQKKITDKYGITMAPVLFVGKLKDFLDGKTIQEASNGKSVLNPALRREGIVIRPTKELPTALGFGRVYLKQRSPDYLAKTDN